MTKKHERVGIIGASCRAMYAFIEPLAKEYAATHEVVGMFDINPRRMQVVNDFLHLHVPSYVELDRFFAEAKPDTVVIATIDSSHVDYIEQSIPRGVRCIVEKPLCIDADQCKRILAAKKKYAKSEALTAHNYRYGPPMLKMKEVVSSGRLGALRSIIFHELLDRRHGSSYFRRWNRRKENSGGLLIHKASHCFDLLNWLVGDRPKSVVATGSLTAYGPKASPFRGERCCTCPHARICPQYVDLSADNFRGELYFRAREPGSYTPDLCAFSPEIDIEDHATVAYDYMNGVRVSFDLCAYAEYEGIEIILQGARGRLEYRLAMSTLPPEQTSRYGTESATESSMTIYEFEKSVEKINVSEGEGDHGGADPAMIRDLFGSEAPTAARASLADGIQAVLIGAAANISIAENRAVDVQSLLK